MAVATGILVAAGISAAASAYAASRQASASEHAVDAQTAADRQALLFQQQQLAEQKARDEERQAYERQQAEDQRAYERARAAPYTGASTAALGTLSSLLGLPTPPPVQVKQSAETVRTVAPEALSGLSPTPGASAMPEAHPLSALYTGSPMSGSGGGGASSYGGSITLQAPDGTRRLVSQTEAQMLRAQHPELQVVS